MENRPTTRREETRMFRRVSLVTLIVLCGLLASTTRSAAQDSGFQLVGFTTATRDGAAGILAMNKLCYEEFSGSRMCMSDEIVASVNPPLGPTHEWAWVHVKLVASLSADHDVFDATGKDISLDNNHMPNCEGWSYTAGISGMTIATDTGAAVNQLCSEQHRIACCAPAP